MASKIKVDNITDQDDNAVISRCGSTHTVTAEVYKADTIKDTSNNTYLAKCGTAVTVGGASQTVSVPGNDIRSNSYKASDGGIIISQSGTTITLGASGDTIQLASGATNDLGAGVQWETTPKTANFNAGAGEGYFVDTSSNEVTVTLPTGVAGESVTILDYVSNANTNAIILSPQSGEKIEGGTVGQGVTANRQATTLTYSGAAQGWLVSSAGDSGPIAPLTITFTTAAGSLGSIAGSSERSDPNANLSPVTGTSTFGTVSYSIQSGSLPAGLTLNSSTGAFVGTATEQSTSTTSNFTVRITVTETGATSDRAFSITVNPDASYVAATGGTVTTSGDFKIHTFTSPGTFCVSSAGNAAGSNTVDYMVVAGGGGGGKSGTSDPSGGGGAGGYRESSGAASGCYSRSPLGSGVSALPVSVSPYPVTVGGGGGGSSSFPSKGSNGSNSVFSSITSAGGGGGASGYGYGGTESSRNGNPGGSGGGAGYSGPGGGGGSVGSGNTPPVSPPQGSPGNPIPGADGGSALSTGSGNGATSSINGSPVKRANGGDGGNPGSPAGPTNSGNGGGANFNGNGNSGGSGIVIIRYRFQT